MGDLESLLSFESCGCVTCAVSVWMLISIGQVLSRILGKRRELFLCLPPVVVQRPIKREMNFTPTVSLRARKSSKSTKMGQIQLIMGPMFSGKTTELIRRLKRYQIARYECLIVKYADDDRYDDEGIATHDRQSLKATKAKTLMSKLRSKLDDYDVIGVDEGQFFPDLVEFCEYAAEQVKNVVSVCVSVCSRGPHTGDAMHQTQTFGTLEYLYAYANSSMENLHTTPQVQELTVPVRPRPRPLEESISHLLHGHQISHLTTSYSHPFSS